jgi:hypothetical protein
MVKEVTLTHLRKLVSKLNKENKIVGAWKMSKPDLLKLIKKIKYEVKHNEKSGKYELRPTGTGMKRARVIKIK